MLEGLNVWAQHAPDSLPSILKRVNKTQVPSAEKERERSIKPTALCPLSLWAAQTVSSAALGLCCQGPSCWEVANHKAQNRLSPLMALEIWTKGAVW